MCCPALLRTTTSPVNSLIFRTTARLAARVHVTPVPAVPLGRSPWTDWTARPFTAARTHYILVTNTASLYSVVLPARGITDRVRFVERALGAINDLLRDDGFGPIPEHLIQPAVDVVICKTLNPSVTGSMTDLVRMADFDLAEFELTPLQTSHRLNQAPMSVIGCRRPLDAFAAAVTDKPM